MKKSFLVLFILIINFNLVLAQQNIFDKIKDGNIYSKGVSEKIERLKLREDIKISEQVVLKPNITLSKNFKGIFNIFDKDLEFEITEDHGADVNDIHGYKAELKEGGYAILSVSNQGIDVSIWYRDYFYKIEAIENSIYFISEMDMDKIIKHDCNYDHAERKLLNKTNDQFSVLSTLSAATMKVFVAYTPAVAQNYNVSTLINQCISTTNIAYGFSLVSSSVQLVGSTQLNYTESGSSETDVNRFMTNYDGYMDEIHSLRNQYEADICVLLVNTSDANGRVPDGAIGAVFSNAFCVVKASAAAGYYSFAHELGHLQGCRHDSDPGSVPYDFAHGHNWYGKMSYFPDEHSYRTIMSINDKGYYRVQYFSNPNVYDQLNNPMGTADYNYCASAIDVRASTIASFEPHYTTSGTMTVNEWWSGTITVTGNVTVGSGVILPLKVQQKVKQPFY
ncbi:MAG: reprolysin-like metallopeptidase [Bacteroidota bacterium]